MRIRSIRHRGLRRLIEQDDQRGVRRDLVSRVRNISAALIVTDNMDDREICDLDLEDYH